MDRRQPLQQHRLVAGQGRRGDRLPGAEGTPIFSWAITHNVHTRGDGSAGGIGGLDADCHGLFIAWNQTPGWVGDMTDRKDVKMTDCAFVANKCDRVTPDDKAAAKLGVPAPLTAAGGRWSRRRT